VLEPEPRLPDEGPAVPGTSVGRVPEARDERPRDDDVRRVEADQGEGPRGWASLTDPGEPAWMTGRYAAFVRTTCQLKASL
jgi:hypothetical protein